MISRSCTHRLHWKQLIDEDAERIATPKPNGITPGWSALYGRPQLAAVPEWSLLSSSNVQLTDPDLTRLVYIVTASCYNNLVRSTLLAAAMPACDQLDGVLSTEQTEDTGPECHTSRRRARQQNDNMTSEAQTITQFDYAAVLHGELEHFCVRI